MTEEELSFDEIQVIYPQYPSGNKVLDAMYRDHALRVKEFYIQQLR
jgi:hypothetical protein